MLKKMFIAIILCMGTQAYALSGDVHGRDLNITGLGWAGHTGVEAANGRILEMLNQRTVSKWGYTSYLFKNTQNIFKSSSSYWGARYWKWLVDNQYWRVYNYVVRNADYIEDIGANYTTTSWYHHPKSYRDSNGKWRIQVGKYRCDTYVRSMYETGGIRFSSNTILPKKVFNAFPDVR